jgi:bifunctional non-homologous end joining protein LigD
MSAIEAQLATLVDVPPRGEQWVFEIKYDGYRAIASKAGDAVEMTSRRGLRYAGFDAIKRRIARLKCHTAVLDGEVCALDERGRPRFEALQTALTRQDDAAFVYFVFDVLSLDDRDLRRLPLRERKKVLAKLIRTSDSGVVRRVVSQAGPGDRFLEAARALGLEGILAKRADRPYRAGRSLEWQKVKAVAQQELVIVGYTPPSGSRLGLGALLLGVHENGVLRYAGKVGTGLGQAMLHTLSQRLRALEVARAPLTDPPRIPGARWVRPELVAEVRFGEWTRDGRLRHPVFLGLRADKKARDVVRESPAQAG